MIAIRPLVRRRIAQQNNIQPESKQQQILSGMACLPCAPRLPILAPVWLYGYAYGYGDDAPPTAACSRIQGATILEPSAGWLAVAFDFRLSLAISWCSSGSSVVISGE
jgi:hypothetical protein